MTHFEEELLKENERLRQIIQRVDAKNGQLEAFIASLNEKKRRIYGPGPWWCENEGCGAKIERPETPKRGFCPRCYMAWYRGEKPEPLGGLEVTLSFIRGEGL